MSHDSVILSLYKRIRLFRKYGYDLPASRKYLLEKCIPFVGKVLEIGSGKGHFTACLAKKRFKIISVDLDPDALRISKKHLTALKLSKQVLFRKINAEKLPFPSRSFNQVVSIDIFHHAKNPFRCLREMMRVTQKNLLIADLNKKGMRVMDRVHQLEGKKHESSRISFKALKRHLERNGFLVKSYRHNCHQIFQAQRRDL